MNILVINGHKYYWYSTGRLNRLLFEEIVNTLSKNNEVKTTIVELGYEVDKEIEKYKWADVIIYQNPINWFGVPWILKKYFDEIFKKDIFFTSNSKYDSSGLFSNKRYMFSLTSVSKESDFTETDGFFDLRNIDDIYISQHKMHQFCGMKKMETFCAYDVMRNFHTERELDRLRFHLNKYFN